LLAALGCTSSAVQAPTSGVCEIKSQTLWACPSSALGNPRLADIGAYIDPNTSTPYPRCGPPGDSGPTQHYTRLESSPCRVSVTFQSALNSCVGDADPGWFIVAEELLRSTTDYPIGGAPCGGGCASPGVDAAWPR
jgi:hypothetical protein